MHLKQPSRLAATHPPDRIVAESIGLDAPVVPVGQNVVDVDGQATALWEVAEYAAGWHKGSALPGRVGNIVLSGHHNIKGEVFRHLEHLQEGDKIVLYADGRPYRYVVQLKMIVKEKGEPLAVREENARWIGPFPDERLTLVACWPYTSNTHRVIVVARPADVSLPLERPIPPAGPPPSPSFAD
jgi:sortase A